MALVAKPFGFAVPAKEPTGESLGAVAVFSDLSRLKELEQEKRRAERLASLEAIASGMVHEIRNPLVSLKAFTQLLPTRFDDPEFRAGLVRVADREISRIDELLGRFRTLASAPAQQMGLVDLLDPLQSALELLLPEREARGVHLRRVGIDREAVEIIAAARHGMGGELPLREGAMQVARDPRVKAVYLGESLDA